MATVKVPISRQDYSAAQDSSELNGWKPNVISGALSGQAITASDTITIDPDFKDHKTVFLFNNTDSAAASVTIKAGNTYHGVKDLVLSVPVGISMIWFDSADFVDKSSGEITVVTTATEKLTIQGYEMR